jgi:putative ABC transport system ATP-binding protein
VARAVAVADRPASWDAPAQLPVAGAAPWGVPVIEARALARAYPFGQDAVVALRSVDLTVWPGESVAIMGASGSGKSTLLHLLGLLDRPTSGAYLLAGVDTATLSDDRLAELRNRAIGFVFQSFNLVAGESALDNVAAPLVYRGVRRAERLRRAAAALEGVGLGGRTGHDPSRLSGGERQRVAIARALVTEPTLLLADEPTGNLDSASGAEVLALVEELHGTGLTVVLVTHDQAVAGRAQRVVLVSDGRVVGGQATQGAASGWSSP